MKILEFDVFLYFELYLDFDIALSGLFSQSQSHI